MVLSWGLKSSYDAIFFAVYEVTLTAVGALMVSRLPRHPVGWILCLFGVQGAVTAELATGWGLRAVEEGWTGGEVAQWVGLVSWCPGALMWVLALLYTPTGRAARPAVASRRVGRSSRYVGLRRRLVVQPVVDQRADRRAQPFRRGLAARPAAHGRRWDAAVPVGGRGAGVAGGAVPSCGRTVRQQLKWVGLAGALLALLLPCAIPLWSVSPIVRAISPLVLSAMALALGAAVLRYRLFDVDLIILRSVALRVRVGPGSGGLRCRQRLPGYRRRKVVGLAGGRRDPGRGSGLPSCAASRAAGPGQALRPRTAIPPGCGSTLSLSTAIGHRAARPDPGGASGGAA